MFPGSFGTIAITDPVKAANKARDKAAREGADLIVAITHLGVTDFDGSGDVGVSDLLELLANWGPCF